jgi:hypothetical protein
MGLSRPRRDCGGASKTPANRNNARNTRTALPMLQNKLIRAARSERYFPAVHFLIVLEPLNRRTSLRAVGSGILVEIAKIERVKHKYRLSLNASA